MDFAKIIAGVVQLFNMIASWLHDRELVDTGKDLQQGAQDAETLKNIKAGLDAKHADNSDLDGELCIESKVDHD